MTTCRLSVANAARVIYTPAVRTKIPSVLWLVGLSLLLAQAGIMHMHLSPEGNSGLHGLHIHDLDPDGHDHETDPDVSLLKSTAGWGKPILFLPLVMALFVIAVTCGDRIWIPVNRTLCLRRYARWRPPLRAPPVPVS